VLVPIVMDQHVRLQRCQAYFKEYHVVHLVTDYDKIGEPSVIA
jgi:hypothetical protein